MKKFQPEKGYDEIFSVVACRATEPFEKSGAFMPGEAKNKLTDY